MRLSRCALIGFALVVATFCIRSASAAEILMPVGSTVWMKFDASVCPDEDLDDCAGSNLPGVAPPNGIPTHTRSNGIGSATGYAEILPDRVRTYIVSNIGAVMNASFQDSYTVGGTAAGPFDITFQLRVTGAMRTVPAGPFNQLLAGSVQARIGTFNPDPLVNENNRVAAFNPGADAGTGAQSLFALGSVPVDITATYTKTGVNVGDVFDIGYQIRSGFSKGELDLLNAGAISFIVPEGVSLTSTMAQALPEPGSIRIVGNDGVNDGITVVNIGAGTTATGTIEITQNPLVETINIANGVSAGNLIITNNDGATTINIAEGTVAGDLTIADNGNAAVNLAANTTVAGNLTLETTGAGTLDLGSPDVSGNLDLTADGYTTVEATTAAVQTALTMINSEATMEMVAPTGAFPAGAPVPFSVEKLTSGAVEIVDGNAATHLERYRFIFDTPTLGQDAELNFEINLLAMDNPSRQSLLDLLHDDALLTLAVRGNDPGAVLQLFEVCAPGMIPVADECVRVLWLDENGLVLDPLGLIDPTVLRFEGLVGHFSTYSIVAVAVPEPTSLSLLILGAVVILRRRHR